MRNACVLAVAAVLVGCGDNRGSSGGPVGLDIEPATPMLAVDEGGAQTTFQLQLTDHPHGTGNFILTLYLESDDPTEGTVEPASITLDGETWSQPQLVTVTGVDDDLSDGDQRFHILIDDGDHDDVQSGQIAVTNLDNDLAQISVASLTEARTTEGGGTAMFSVVLDAQPASDVTIPVASGDPGEGTASPTTLTFTRDNWNAPQIVTVTGVDDPVADGNASYAIQVGAAVSDDPRYAGVDAEDPAFVNVDNDSPGIIVTPTGALETTEAGGTATFTVVLASQPLADVRLDLTSSDPGEGTPMPTRLTFTPANWNAVQIVTVTGANDALDDGDQPYTIELQPLASSDVGYAGIDPPDVAVTNIDDEAPGFVVMPTSGLVTSEAGGTASFTVALLSAPTAPVTIAVSSSRPAEGTPETASLTFTPADWQTAQTVTVRGEDDAVADGAQPYTIVLAAAASSDPAYAGVDPDDVSVTNTDNDTAGFTVAPTTGLAVSELGDTATFTIVLNSQPTAAVTVGLSVSDTTEGSVSPGSVTFSPANWNMAQTITVTGVDDPIADGNQTFTVVTGLGQSTDPRYRNLDPANVVVTNFDDDAAQVVVDSAPLLQVSEDGTTATFTMVLTRMPTANVTCTVTSLDTTEGTVTPASVVFTSGNFDQPRTFTVRGVDDTTVDGAQNFTIRTNACTSTDPAYSGLNPRDVSVRNADND